jgi:hypothetical protein
MLSIRMNDMPFKRAIRAFPQALTTRQPVDAKNNLDGITETTVQWLLHHRMNASADVLVSAGR